MTLGLHAQRLETERILETTDSLIEANTNVDLVKYFEVSVGSYYKYEKKNNYISTAKFLSKKKLKNNTTEIWVLYHFKNSSIDGIRGATWIKLNPDLTLKEPIDLSFIPKFMWENKECDFISKKDALQIGINNFEKQGIKIEEPILQYNKDFELYIYELVNVLTKTKNQLGRDAGVTEVVRLNAKTGELIDRFDGAYGIIIR